MADGKHIALRTCIGCRQIKPKSELLAITRLKNNDIVINADFKDFGRSVYLCKKKECVEMLLNKLKKKNTLNYYLKGNVPDKLIENLKELIVI